MNTKPIEKDWCQKKTCIFPLKNIDFTIFKAKNR
jgi:hypothetical protein